MTHSAPRAPRPPRTSPSWALAAAGGLSLLAACATRPLPPGDQQGGLTRAAEQPLRDLSVIRETAPEALQRAARDPYDIAGLTECKGAADEVARLDAALGPDLTPGGKTSGVTVHGLAVDLVGGAVELPYGGVVRTVTGAESRNKALRTAVLAGMVRRGFVKGRMALMSCPSPLVAVAQPAVIPRSSR